MKIILTIFCSIIFYGCSHDTAVLISSVSSPDGNITASIYSLKKESITTSYSTLQYSVTLSGKTVIQLSPLGIIRHDQEFSKNLSFVSKNEPVIVKERYLLKSGKRLRCENYCREINYTFENSNASRIQIIFRVYNDGIAFRYVFPGKDSQMHTIIKEETGFSIPTNSISWLQPYRPDKPSYEQHFKKNTTKPTSSPDDSGWCFPALFNFDSNWVLLTESGLDEQYCGSHLDESDNNGLFRIRFPEKKEKSSKTGEQPTSTLPWTLPWRVIIIGSQPSAIIESNIVQHVSEACSARDTSWIQPGHAVWSWWSQENSPSDYTIQMRYITYAFENNIKYVLIDEGWQSIPENKLRELIAYASAHNIGIFLWYNSGAGKPANPIDHNNIMSIKEKRKKEFIRLQNLGVKGIKVDFFLSDKQPVIKLYTDILKDAVQHKLMVNFHGSTIPRGWEKTYPNLMTMEAVRGAESFYKKMYTDTAPEQNTILPFTRNAVGSMDYTPLTFDLSTKGIDQKRGNAPVRITTYCHELALAVIFESGITHYADSISTYEHLPAYVRRFMGNVPAAWDETRFIDGKPGEYIVLARRIVSTWYIAGINGQNKPKSLTLVLPFSTARKLNSITDSMSENTFVYSDISVINKTFSVTMKPYGGFTAVSQ
jgi:alpha-glucosidase